MTFFGFLWAVAAVAAILLLTRRFWAEPFFAWYRRHSLPVVLGALLLLFLVVFLAPDVFFTMTPGEVGVLWSRFGGGTQLDAPYPEGTYLKLPWDKVYKYDVRFQRATAPVDAITKEGLKVLLEIVVRFRAIDKRAGLLHKQVGPRYVTTLVLPELGAYARHVVSRRTAEEVYGLERNQIQQEIFQAMKQHLPIAYDRAVNPEKHTREPSVFFVELEDLLIESVTLPVKVEQAIESKIEQLYLNEEYVYRLARERNEMLRKGIEGEGIALFQSKVSQGISERYLKWKGIDATLELAKSNNAKIVVIGAGKDGLPLILGGFGEEAAGGAARAAAAAPPGAVAPDSRSAAVAPQGAGSAVIQPGGEQGGGGERGGGGQASLVEAEAALRRWLAGETDARALVQDSLRRAKEAAAGARGSGPKAGQQAPRRQQDERQH